MAEPQPVFFKDSARRVQCKMKVNKLQFIKQTAINIILSKIKRLPSPSHSLGEGSLFR